MENTMHNFQNYNNGFLLLVLAIFILAGAVGYAIAKFSNGGSIYMYEAVVLTALSGLAIYFVKKANRLREE